MEAEAQGCIVCNSNPKHCFCPTCAHDKLADVRRFLRQVQTKRTSVAKQLEVVVPHKVCDVQPHVLKASAVKSFSPGMLLGNCKSATATAESKVLLASNSGL